MYAHTCAFAQFYVMSGTRVLCGDADFVKILRGKANFI